MLYETYKLCLEREVIIKAFFFDRDGVVNRSPGAEKYVCSLKDFHIYPAFLSSLEIVFKNSYIPLIITNQQCIGKGLVTAETITKIHNELLYRCNMQKTPLKDIYICPHLAEDLCDCRKPKPGMILKASKKYGIDLSKSWMVGDSQSDMDAAISAGCRTIGIGKNIRSANIVVNSIWDLPRTINNIIGKQIV